MAWVVLGGGIALNALADDANPKQAFEALLTENARIKAAARDAGSAKARVTDIKRRQWTPNIDFTLDIGRQRYESMADPTPPTLDAAKATLRATQLISDFGRSRGQIDEAESVALQSQAVSQAARDGVLLEALTAHWSLIRAKRVLYYAQQSEASVRKQAALEDSLVELGKGYASNVLQAKVQLASAEARRVRSEGAADIAQARLRAIFEDKAGAVSLDQVIKANTARLPNTLEEAQKMALEGNAQIIIGHHRSTAIQHRLAFTGAKEFRPRLQLMAEHSERSNTDAALDGPRYGDSKLMLQFQYNLNAGLAGKSAEEAVRQDYEASLEREVETRNLILEQVHIAWRNLQVAKQNKTTLANQVRIAAKFFELATAERQLGRRNLLDVLTAEVALINAFSDLVSTEVDEAIAGLTLLQATGGLDLPSLIAEPVNTALSSMNE